MALPMGDRDVRGVTGQEHVDGGMGDGVKGYGALDRAALEKDPSIDVAMATARRHCENILLDTTNGECVHVDFNCLFNKGALRWVLTQQALKLDTKLTATPWYQDLAAVLGTVHKI